MSKPEGSANVEAKTVAAAAQQLTVACQEVERIGQYIQRGVVPSPQFVAPRLKQAQAARENLDAAVADVLGEEAPAPARIRPRG